MNRRHKLYLIIYHLFVTLTHIFPQLTCLTPPPPLTEYATTGRVWCPLVRFVIQYIEGGGPLLSPIGNYKEDTARSFHHHQGHIQGWGLGEENRINCIKIDPSDESERKLVHLLPLLPVPYVHMPPIPPPVPTILRVSCCSWIRIDIISINKDGPKIFSINGDDDFLMRGYYHPPSVVISVSAAVTTPTTTLV